MFSLTIKGKENPKSPQLVKLEMIFFKTGYYVFLRIIH